MQLHQRGHISRGHVRQQRRPYRTRIVHHMGDRVPFRDILCRLRGRHWIQQVRFDEFTAQVGGSTATSDRNDMVAVIQQPAADRRPDTRAAAGDDRDRHGCRLDQRQDAQWTAGALADFQRRGQYSNAPVGGSRSRFVRHCSP